LKREVVEEALRKGHLDVVFSTPTLAAGVNFPIRTVVFDSFYRRWVSEWIAHSEFLNMSGRAGRLGLDDKGLSVLITGSRTEFIQAKNYLTLPAERISSKLFSKSIRKSVLNLISSGICNTEDSLNNFYASSFWWHQHLEHNPKKTEDVPPLVAEAVQWLIENKLLVEQSTRLVSTPLGTAISGSGLLPATGVSLINVLRLNNEKTEEGLLGIPLLHAICSSAEFDVSTKQRHLPFARRNQPETIAWKSVNQSNLLIPAMSSPIYDRVVNAAYGLDQWAKGISERKLRRDLPSISYGQFQTLASDVSWVIVGLSKIVTSADSGVDKAFGSSLLIYSNQIRYGVSVEALDIVVAAKSFSVPGFGRQRAMALAEVGLSDPNQLLKSSLAKIAKRVDSLDRAKGLVEAVGRYFEKINEYWKILHEGKAAEVGIKELIERSYSARGHEYEEVVEEMMKMFGWEVIQLDDGRRKGVPDFSISFGDKQALLECKTKQKDDATIDKDEAFDVFTKAVSFSDEHLITLGKPEFDTFSKVQANGSQKVTLVPHYAFAEAYILFLNKKISSEEAFEWLLIPGVANIDLLYQS